jgi:hypothetical protein
MHNSKNHIPLGKDIGYIEMTGVCAAVDNAIHIQIQMIKLGQERLIRNDLVYFWISLTKPAVKLKKS